MNPTKYLLIFLLLVYTSTSFYIQKKTIPTLFTNQQQKFIISHNGGDNIQFVAEQLPQFVNLKNSGILQFFPKKQGAFQLTITCFNTLMQKNLTHLTYFVLVLDQLKQFQKSLWLIDEQNYYSRVNQRPLTVQTDQFDFHSPIMTNQNIRLKLKIINSVGNVSWFYENLQSTMKGDNVKGVISGYVEKEGVYMYKCIAVDSTFRIGQIYLFLKFIVPTYSLQQEGYSTYPQYDYFKEILLKQKQQNAALFQNQLKQINNQQTNLNSERLKQISNFRNITLRRQQMILDEQVISQSILKKTDESNSQLNNLTKLQKQLELQKKYVQQIRKILTEKQKYYSTKLQEVQNSKSMKDLLISQSSKIKSDLNKLKSKIQESQNKIYQLQTDIRDSQFERGRQNVSYIASQKQQVRTREILEIRKNIQFQYIIKKAQIDNKVRKSEDFVFLTQSNYDSLYSQYKRLSSEYIKYSIQSSYLQSQIQSALQQHDSIVKTLNKLKLNYVASQGSFQTLKTVKDQLNRLTNYVLNNTVNNKPDSNLTQIQIIEKSAIKQNEEYPFAGCKKLGTFLWAGTGKVQAVGMNSLTLGSEQTINFGKCTLLATKSNTTFALSANQWIKFTGYFWDGAIQANSIQLISSN